jgi:extracellular factor (EF) 3-hydroxypalmitic acid methyl ester biosynthesis protein
MHNSSEVLELDVQETLIEKATLYSKPCSFAAGEVIMSPAETTKTFYYVAKGTVEVGYTDQNDTRITVALIGAGEFFGEIGFFDGETRVRDIQANNDVDVGFYDQKTMDVMREEDPELYMDFLAYITQKICRKFRRIAGEREPVNSYADSLATRRSVRYSDSKPLPASLLHSKGWHFITSRMEKCKAGLFDLSHQLQQKEAQGARDETLERQCIDLVVELNGSLGAFQRAMDGSGYEEVMWGYVFKEFYPYLMRSRFAERAYFKPKGYAGDFLMMEHIYANTPKGEGRLGELIDTFCLERPGSLAIHGRRKLIKNELTRMSNDLHKQGKITRIMNLACGPNRELFDFIAECDHSESVEALCVDIDAEALQYTNQYVNIFPHMASIRLMSENVIKWSLGRASHKIEPMDIIYSAGLCDYLDTRLFRALVTQCYKHLKPGGSLLLGNFTAYPDSLFLDKILKWELIYRDADELKELFKPTPFGENVVILAEKENVNLFALATKD